jgi:hypothetical protein
VDASSVSGVLSPDSSDSSLPRLTDCGLPSPYRIMSHTIPFTIPGFERHFTPFDYTLAPEPLGSSEWFARFNKRVQEAIGRRYLPICRMADGEYLFLFGYQSPSLRWRPWKRFLLACHGAGNVARALLKGFDSTTTRGVSSGQMSWAEWQLYRATLSQAYRELLSEGILAMHLGVSVIPWQEEYFPALGRWLAGAQVVVTPDNYVPFYFMYALLRGPARRDILGGRNIVVVHSATGEKRKRIEASLARERVRRVEWLPVSRSRSFEDVLDLTSIRGRTDLCLIGAGVGKANVIRQLKPLGAPCLDAGFVFEVWADPAKQWERPMMTPDCDFDIAKVRFLSEPSISLLKAYRAGDMSAVMKSLDQVRRLHAIRLA